MSKDPDYIVKVEQAIAKKYGEEAIQNPKAEWDENKEKVYLEQMRELYKKQKKNDEANDKVEVNGIKVSRKRDWALQTSRRWRKYGKLGIITPMI